MDFVLENDYLKVTVTSKGAQVASVLRKIDGVEHMWQAFDGCQLGDRERESGH